MDMNILDELPYLLTLSTVYILLLYKQMLRLNKIIIYICEMYVLLKGICIFTTENIYDAQIISRYNLK